MREQPVVLMFDGYVGSQGSCDGWEVIFILLKTFKIESFYKVQIPMLVELEDCLVRENYYGST